MTIPVGYFRAGPAFVLRTPLLPLEDYLRWTRAQRPEALANAQSSGTAAGVAELREWVRDSVVREALFIASPSLHDAIDRWLLSPNWDADTRMVRTLLSYRARMSSRSTPFGIFAKYAVGTVGDATVLRLEGRNRLRRSVRLDFSVIEELARTLADAPEVRDCAPLVINDTIHRIGGRICYIEAKYVGEVRRHAQVRLDDSPEFRIVESAAGHSGGATRTEIASALTAFDPTITTEDALTFVDDLRASDLLRPALLPPLTGGDGLRTLTSRIRSIPGASRFADRLEALGALLETAERTPLGEAIPVYRDIASRISSHFGVTTTPGKALQIDLIDDSPGVSMDATLASRITRGLDVLHRICSDHDRADLEKFTRTFAERYEDREIPLLEALDSDTGLGFGSIPEGGQTALVRELDHFYAGTPGGALSPQRVDPLRQAALLRIAADAIVRGNIVHELSAQDIEDLTIQDRPPLPDAFTALVTMVKAPARDLSVAAKPSEPQVLLAGTVGPSALRYFGRFCQRDQRLARIASELAQAEEALRPECDFVEVVHLPDGRTGNVAARPLLRKHELPYLTPAGAQPTDTVWPQDLLVSVRGTEVVLRSRVTGRRVLPRLASAHYMLREGLLPLYRFLGAIQGQGCCEGLEWRWEGAEPMIFLPRIQKDGIVYAKARWRLRWTEISNFSDPHEGLRQFRERWKMPALVEIEEGDNRLLLDLETLTGRSTLLHRLEGRGGVRLVELWPPATALGAEGDDGGLTHEIVLPFTRYESSSGVGAETNASTTDSLVNRHDATAVRRLRRTSTSIKEQFTLGSEWTFLKLYAGLGNHDRLLVDGIQPVIDELHSRDTSIKFFFVRYADPDWHLRLRVRQGELAGAHIDATLALNARLACSSLIWQSHFATYNREIERYGGPACIDEAESWFHLDTQFAVSAITRSRSDGSTMREVLALAAINSLLTAAIPDLAERWRFAQMHRDRFVSRLAQVKSGQVFLRRALSRQARGLGPIYSDLTRFMDPKSSGEADDVALRSILNRRADAAIRFLRSVEAAAGIRAVSVRAQVLGSIVHMSVNRLMNGRHRLHELAIYDTLTRLYAREASMAE